jgi:hypothetical protein
MFVSGTELLIAENLDQPDNHLLRLEQPWQIKNLVHWHDKPNEPTKTITIELFKGLKKMDTPGSLVDSPTH